MKEYKDHYELISDWTIEWLRDQPPEVWHVFAPQWNFDSGLGPLLWLAKNERCYAATIQRFFHMLEPDEHQVPSSYEDEGTFELINTIIERWPNKYASGIAWPSGEPGDWYANADELRDAWPSAEASGKKEGARFIFPKTLYEPTEGRILRDDEVDYRCINGVPEAVCERVRSADIHDKFPYARSWVGG